LYSLEIEEEASKTFRKLLKKDQKQLEAVNKKKCITHIKILRNLPTACHCVPISSTPPSTTKKLPQ
jgi:mRNA-degrading endonuclease RelE of RelBE toxin-antitoxin system